MLTDPSTISRDRCSKNLSVKVYCHDFLVKMMSYFFRAWYYL